MLNMQNIFKHVCCRNTTYAKSSVKRFAVPDELIKWDQDYNSYDPPFYESNVLKGKPWADPSIDDSSFTPTFNSLIQSTMLTVKVTPVYMK